MKILIAYGTKYGCTEKRAKSLAQKLSGQVRLCNLKKEKDIDIVPFDTVIVGSSIYAGQIRKEVKSFCEKYKQQLLTKKLGLFVCQMEVAKSLSTIENAFNRQLVSHAAVKGGFGGEFDFSKMNFFEKAIIKAMSKSRSLIVPVGDIEGYAKKIQGISQNQ